MPPRHPRIAHALGLVRRHLGVVSSGAAARDAVEPPCILVACSGGPDSIALLGLLHLVARRDGLRLAVGHVDHGLRPASADEAAMVTQVAAGMGIAVDVARLSLAAGAGLPARARAARRAALREQARACGASFVALGHTATDQAETMLLHLSRGAGLAGLAAMAPFDPWDAAGRGPGGQGADGPGGPREPSARSGGWLRPLLDLERAHTRALARALELPFVDDPTNDDPAHPRVRVRHQVLPVLRGLNPKVESALARAAAHAREADEALERWAAEQWRGRRRPIAAAPSAGRDGRAHARIPPSVTSTVRWSTQGMDQLPRAVRTRFVRRICRDAGAPEDALAARTLASIDDALVHPGPRRAWDLYPHLRVCIADGHLWTEDASAASHAANH